VENTHKSESETAPLVEVENTTDLSFCIDWLTIVFPKEADHSSIYTLIEKLNWCWTEFTEMKGGMNGYLYRISKDNINILWGTPKNSTPMGICISISGNGCRQLEVENFNWFSFLNRLNELSANFTRIDLAIDDFHGHLNISQMYWYLEHGFATSRFRSFKYDKERSLNGRMMGEELKIGKRTSEVYIRFYDKKLERNAKDISKNIWNRYEIELKNNQAETAVALLLENNLDGATLTRKILANYINFKSKHSKGKNKSRWKNTNWWDIFLASCQGISLSQKQESTSLFEKTLWLKKVSSSTLKMLTIALENDRESILKFLSDCIDQAELSKEKADLALSCTDLEKQQILDYFTEIHNQKIDTTKF
jgi:phage replication initiation protein